MTASVYDTDGLCRWCRERDGTAHASECRHDSGPVPAGARYQVTAPDGTVLTEPSRHRAPVCAVLVLTRRGWAVWSSHTTDQAAQVAIDRIEVPYDEVTVVPVDVLPDPQR